MTDLEPAKLAESLRSLAICKDSDYEGGGCEGYDMIMQAADVIEELQAAVSGYEATTDVEFIKEDGHERIRFVPKWIPVTERLPKDNEAVNVLWVNHSPALYYQHIKDKTQTATGVYYRGQWYWWSAVVQDYLAEYGECWTDKMDTAIEVTHWLPLPTQPKEET